jgi:L-threonylcarbamoyladenylate synthase
MTDARHIVVDPGRPDPRAIARAAAAIRRGELVAFPTETVYGLGADALDPAAVARIYEAKGRPSYNPLIVHVLDAVAARGLVTAWPPAAQRLADACWPGPVTLVLPKAPAVPDAVTAGLPAVALRVPAHPVALALLRAAERPIAAPSANRSNELSPTTAAHVASALGDRVALILDAGPTDVGIESTVVDLTGPRPRLLRPGLVSRDELVRLIGDIADPEPASGDVSRSSPGQLERHYAPQAELRLVDDPEAGRAALGEARLAGHRAALLTYDAVIVGDPDVALLPGEPAGYARRLYAALHDLDARDYNVVYVVRPPAEAAWEGIHDRLRRAAHR